MTAFRRAGLSPAPTTCRCRRGNRPPCGKSCSSRGIIEAEPFAERPRFSEPALVHAPTSACFFAGKWHEGLLPTDAVGPVEPPSTGASWPKSRR